MFHFGRNNCIINDKTYTSKVSFSRYHPICIYHFISIKVFISKFIACSLIHRKAFSLKKVLTGFSFGILTSRSMVIKQFTL